MKDTLTIEETAERLGVSKQCLRVMLQRNLIPIGYAIPNTTGKGYRYIISKHKLDKYLGLEQKE